MTGLQNDAVKRYHVSMTLSWTGDIEATDEEQAEALAVEKFAEGQWDEQHFEILDEKELPQDGKGSSK